MSSSSVLPRFIQIHPDDNLLVALNDMPEGTRISYRDRELILREPVRAKHKFTIHPVERGGYVRMYGVVVGKAIEKIEQGGVVSLRNIRHATADVSLNELRTSWQPPDISRYANMTFNGYHRKDGSVGTANHWIVIPLVYCENRNLDVLKEALEENLGYAKANVYRQRTRALMDHYKRLGTVSDLGEVAFEDVQQNRPNRFFKNVDGIKFLKHGLGCCGTALDTKNLCGLLTGYITNPNVAGATVLSLGCQNAQIQLLLEELNSRDPHFSKPLVLLEQQNIGTEEKLMNEALKRTFEGLAIANTAVREPAPLSKLCIGLECGGSDGFSGISSNPAVGHASDLVATLGGTTILSEFPELCGVEQELAERCVRKEDAERFLHLMKNYNAKAEALGSGFYANPTAGNIRDGLITDAIKSAGAARKGGTSPIAQILDYPEKVTRNGLTLLCTPGGDVESTTAMVGAGANMVLFTTGLGTPTGNPVAPTIKISSNTALYNKMSDIIDINCGTIIDGEESIQQAGERILDMVIRVASGEAVPKAVALGQDDFLPWKRDISL
jgi:altronate hydrolase